MNRILFNLYRVIVPKPIRKRLLKRKLKIKITELLESLTENELDNEKKAVLKFIKIYGVAIFPYKFTLNYLPSDIKVYTDVKKGLKYVIQKGKRLYFKRRWSVSRIKRAYNQLLMEQDKESPHCYLTDKFKVDADDVLVDFGTAEGNFSLSVIEKIKHVYLFEVDKEWIDALKATFQPWKEKVTIIQKYVSDVDDFKGCTGDGYFKNKKISFLKIDVEGAERKLLLGIKNILEKTAPLKIALCTYHKQDDKKEFTQLLEQHNFNVEASQGYMIYYLDKKIKSPYLRRGLIRAHR